MVSTISKLSKKNTLLEYIKFYNEYTEKFGKIILFYQFGCCYEIYGVNNDQEKLGNIENDAEILGIRVTCANKKLLSKENANSRDNPLMAGFPLCSLNDYIDKATSNDYTAVIINEFSDPNPKNKKKIRKYIGAHSPGTRLNNIAEDNDVNIMLIDPHFNANNINNINYSY
jgi:DNA mismatch repair ATPase MutS